MKRMIVTAVLLTLTMSLWAEEAAETKEATPDPERVLLTLNGKEFKGWMADAMIAHRAAPSVEAAADMWVDIQLKAAEARKRGIDAARENAFILDLYQDFFLSGSLLGQAMEKEVAEPTEEALRANYDENIERYKRPMNANVMHITVRDRELANEILAKAKAPEANFEELVTAFSKAQDKNRKGQIRGGYQALEKQLGKDAAEAITNAADGALLGPFLGTQGFEIIKVTQVTPDTIVEFEKVKDGIAAELKSKAAREHHDALVEELKAKADIVKSEELEPKEEDAGAEAAVEAAPAQP